jgi:hypothetical protein
MQRHPYFDLWLHEDAELAALLGSPVTGRTTVHEWPLSCVQRLTLADGRTQIYKAQAPPTVEPDFYVHARSPLLVTARLCAAPDGPAALLLDALTAPRLADSRPSAKDGLCIAETILAQIGQIAGAPPVIADIRSSEQWAAYAGTMLADLTALVESGAFHQTDHALIDRLRRQALAPGVLAAFRTPTGCVHRDLSGDNIFVLPEGYRVIDWQRPLLGPVLLDFAALLQTVGLDPRQHIDAGILQLRDLLSIAWVVQCARTWFPPGAATYDAAVVRLAAQVAPGDNLAS